MLQHAIAYGAAAVVFLALDFVWLTRIAKNFYMDRLGELLLGQPRLGVAAGFYVLYLVGIVVFAVSPALRAESARLALLLGGLFGLIAYGTYDMTNLATLRNWPVSVALVDMGWGALISAVSATAGYYAVRLVAA